MRLETKDKIKAGLIVSVIVVALFIPFIAVQLYKESKIKQALPTSKHITVELACINGNTFTLDGQSVRLGDAKHPTQMTCEESH